MKIFVKLIKLAILIVLVGLLGVTAVKLSSGIVPILVNLFVFALIVVGTGGLVSVFTEAWEDRGHGIENKLLVKLVFALLVVEAGIGYIPYLYSMASHTPPVVTALRHLLIGFVVVAFVLIGLFLAVNAVLLVVLIVWAIFEYIWEVL